MVFGFFANAASILTLASNAVEAGKIGARNAAQNARNAVAIKDIRDYTGDSVLNKASEKHNAMKEIVRNGDFTTGFYKAGGAVSGFAKGVWEGMKGNWLSTGFAVMTLASKSKNAAGNTSRLKIAGVIGMTCSLVYDFIKNGTNLFTRKNTIEK